MACKYYIDNKVLSESEVKTYIGENYVNKEDIKLTTLGDIANILAYSNSKLILPGYEVEYTTPDNIKFKTYAEASNHISELSKNVKDVDLNNISLSNFNMPDKFEIQEYDKTYVYEKRNGQWYEYLKGDTFFKEEKVTEDYVKKGYINNINKLQDFIDKNKEYEQSKEIIEEWKKVNNIRYNPEEIYSRGQEFSSVVGAYSNFDVNLMMQNLLSHIEDNEKANNHNKITSKDKIVFGHPGIGKTYLRESGRTDVIDFDSDYKSKINKKFNLPEGFKARNDFQKSNKEEYQKAVRELWNEAKKESKETGKQLFASDMILLREFSNDFDKVITMSKETFIERAKQRNDYTPGLEGTEGWKNSLDKEIAKVDKSKVINTNGYLSDLFSKGSGFAISAYTKPIDKQIGHLEGGGGKIKFKIYPQSNDILWAANTDVYSGSVWDASEKVNKDKKSELLGVSYTKYPSLNNVNAVRPNLASIVDDLAHHHNELGIVLTGNNFRLEYDDDIPYQTKKIIDGINKILDQKYGKLNKPEIKKDKKQTILINNPLPEDERSGVLSYSSDYDGGYFLDTLYGYERKGYAFGDKIFYLKVQKILKIVYPNSNVTIEPITNKVLVDGKDIIPYKGLKYETPDKIKKEVLGIQPTQTNETLKESIDSVKNKVMLKLEDNGEFTFNNFTYGTEYNADTKTLSYYKKENIWGSKEIKISEAEFKGITKKEYTEQALINTKIAKLKEVAKKYPRSLIRSEVKRINTSSSQELYDQFGEDELPFQKVSKEKQIEILYLKSIEISEKEIEERIKKCK